MVKGRGKPVDRFDFARIDGAKVSRTPQGFLRVGGNLTRVGVLDYHRADGSVFRELRLPEEVFKADSLATMKLAPVTELHPSGMVTPTNVGQVQVGIVSEDVKHDDRFVIGDAVVQRQDTMSKVMSRALCELSPGYRCWVETREGEWHGQKYDGIQRDIEYNHLAVGPKDWGRSGNDVALRLDGLDDDAGFARMDNHDMGRFLRDRFSLLQIPEAEIAQRLQIDLFELSMLMDGFTTPEGALLERISGLIEVPVEKLQGFIPASEKGELFTSPQRRRDGNTVTEDNKKGTVPMKKIQIVLDGVAYEIEVAEALATTFESAIAKMRTDADDAKATISRLEGELEVAKKDAADTKTKLDEATAPDALAKAAKARVKLVTDCKAIDPEFDADAHADSSDRDLKVAALVKAGHEQATFDGKDDAFVDGMFAATAKKAPEQRTDDQPGQRSTGPTPGQGGGTDEKFDSDAARQRMVERNRSMSGGNLDFTKPGFEQSA